MEVEFIIDGKKYKKINGKYTCIKTFKFNCVEKFILEVSKFIIKPIKKLPCGKKYFRHFIKKIIDKGQIYQNLY